MRPLRSVVGIASWWALLLAACAGGPPLNDARSTPPYRELLHLGAELERVPTLVRVEDPGAPPLSMQVIAVRQGPARPGPLVVLVPGVLATHDTWRFLAPLLAPAHDLLLVDLPGTGGSDGPDPGTTPAPAYTPTWIGRHVLRAVDRWQQARGDARTVAVVAHSLGSASIVRALAAPAVRAEVPALCARLSGLVLLAHPDVLEQGNPPTLEAVATLSDLEATLGGALGVIDRRVADGIWDGVVDPEHRALKGDADRIASLLVEGRTRHVAQAMLRRFRPVDAQGHPLREAARRIAAAETGVPGPKLLIWGARDTTLPVAMAHVVARRLSDVTLRIAPDARHSVQQERPELAATWIRDFLAGSVAGAVR